MPRLALAMAWGGICSAMVYLFIGAGLALQYGVRNALIGMVLAVIAFGLLCGFLARYAARTGMSSAVLSQAMLGRWGGAVATLILCATGIYYAVFEGSVLAVAMSKVIPGLGYGAAALVVVAYSTPLVFGSVQNWINKLNGVLLPFYLAGIAALVWASFARQGGSLDLARVGPTDPEAPFGWWFCMSTYLGVLVMAMCTMDFARFGRPEDARWHSRWTFGMPFYLVTYLMNGVVGIMVVATLEAATISETAVVDASLALLGGGIGLVWVFVSQTRVNTANFLIGTLNLQAFLIEIGDWRLSKRLCALLVGLITFTLMRSTDIFSHLIVALNWQAVFTTAWVGVALSFVATRRQELSQPIVGYAGLGAWVLSALIGCGTLAFGGQSGRYWYPIVTVATAIAAHRLLSAFDHGRARST